MNRRYSVDDYLGGEETLDRQELEWGRMVREACPPKPWRRGTPGPFYRHQSAVTELTVLLATHVRAYDLGRVVVSPIDVVLDAERALVVQPDIVFVSTERLSIIRNQIWGAPDLVVEVLSAGTQKRDRTKKVGWYREYGVRECWLVDESAQRVEIHELGPARRVRRFGPQRRIRSTVLTQLTFRAGVIFRASL
jgi:Uma2 family endonuclease